MSHWRQRQSRSLIQMNETKRAEAIVPAECQIIHSETFWNCLKKDCTTILLLYFACFSTFAFPIFLAAICAPRTAIFILYFKPETPNVGSGVVTASPHSWTLTNSQDVDQSSRLFVFVQHWHLQEKQPGRKDNPFKKPQKPIVCFGERLPVIYVYMICKYAKTCKNTGAILQRHPFVFVAASLHKPQGKGLKARCRDGGNASATFLLFQRVCASTHA